ncbi:hypothetical protein SAMN04487970_107412 [Paenibacillus tianmuensis]|uniref:Uncharacterized protein n=1 Tax=Paenibacillus tianmuensis TaxID=624147 RepID=A0A1G4TX07_9BACL|nr:hypothetical protein [Paenibacillus tianmuensis]SCW85900.1 hypothetical protein SAMN04487970_107412 [Paenibacillus tianmuensis]
MTKQRHVGQSFRAVVMPIKIKNGIPTVISLGGQVYILQGKDQFRGENGGNMGVKES